MYICQKCKIKSTCTYQYRFHRNIIQNDIIICLQYVMFICIGGKGKLTIHLACECIWNPSLYHAGFKCLNEEHKIIKFIFLSDLK